MVISGFNFRGLIAFCRWASENDVDYRVIARNTDDPIFKTRYESRVSVVRSSATLGPDELTTWADVLRTETGAQEILILPSTEYLNRTLLKNRDRLEKAGCIVPLVDSELYEQLSDKESFARLCAERGIEIPNEFASLPTEIPFVAKPRAYANSSGKQLIPQLILSDADLLKFEAEEHAEDYFFQEYVGGKSLYLLAHVDQEHGDLLFSQENLMQQPFGGAVVLARASNLHQDPLAALYLDMLHELKFRGLIMIEVRSDQSSGRACMIEANPRIWGPLQFSLDNGVDFLGAFLSNYGITTSPKVGTERSAPFYFWSGGLQAETDQPAYHNYSQGEFAADFAVLKANELFLREDTLNLYLNQSGRESNHG